MVRYPESPQPSSFESGDDEEKIRKRITSAKNFNELIDVVSTIDEGLWGTSAWYSKRDLVFKIISLRALAQLWPVNEFENKLNKQVADITRTRGLREKVTELALEVLEKRRLKEQEENE